MAAPVPDKRWLILIDKTYFELWTKRSRLSSGTSNAIYSWWSPIGTNLSLTEAKNRNIFFLQILLTPHLLLKPAPLEMPLKLTPLGVTRRLSFVLVCGGMSLRSKFLLDWWHQTQVCSIATRREDELWVLVSSFSCKKSFQRYWYIKYMNRMLYVLYIYRMINNTHTISSGSRAPFA